ncbi:hypothetical protein BDN72DRAFT_187675 [Pluteus cervinus]|uniref:Uncharacterized protein n=1 Tax=Pluteus cervinus TaxID=181527 RepID=A0ACD3B5G2_9AGAR|nr:hypothetical protein BDN72DRAFT_187675 [Pluteus cervinus]
MVIEFGRLRRYALCNGFSLLLSLGLLDVDIFGGNTNAHHVYEVSARACAARGSFQIIRLAHASINRSRSLCAPTARGPLSAHLLSRVAGSEQTLRLSILLWLLD